MPYSLFSDMLRTLLEMKGEREGYKNSLSLSQ